MSDLVYFCMGPQAARSQVFENSARVLRKIYNISSKKLVVGEAATANLTGGPYDTTLVSIDSRNFQNAQFDADDASVFASLLSWDGFQQFRFVSIKMLGRVDTTGTFGFLERELEFESFCLRVIHHLRNESPSLIVFSSTPHIFHQYVVWRVAEFLAIPALFFQPSPLAPAMLPRTAKWSPVSIPMLHRSSENVRRQLSDALRLKLEALKGGSEPTYIQIQRISDVTAIRNGKLLRGLRHLVSRLRRQSDGSRALFSELEDTHPVIARLIGLILEFSRRKSLQGAMQELTDVPDVSGNRFCVFALHYEPERTSLPEGDPWDSQFSAVIATRGLLPKDVKLLVKEHYSQSSGALRGHLGRSKRFYNALSTLDGVEVLAPSVDMRILLESADAVFTLTGSVSVEAAMMGVPVAYFGNPWWEGMPGSIRVNSTTRYGQIIELRGVSSVELERFLEQLTLDRMVPGVSGESMEKVTERFGTLSSDFFEAQDQAIARIISTLVAGDKENGSDGH